MPRARRQATLERSEDRTTFTFKIARPATLEKTHDPADPRGPRQIRVFPLDCWRGELVDDAQTRTDLGLSVYRADKLPSGWAEPKLASHTLSAMDAYLTAYEQELDRAIAAALHRSLAASSIKQMIRDTSLEVQETGYSSHDAARQAEDAELSVMYLRNYAFDIVSHATTDWLRCREARQSSGPHADSLEELARARALAERFETLQKTGMSMWGVRYGEQVESGFRKTLRQSLFDPQSSRSLMEAEHGRLWSLVPPSGEENKTWEELMGRVWANTILGCHSRGLSDRPLSMTSELTSYVLGRKMFGGEEIDGLAFGEEVEKECKEHEQLRVRGESASPSDSQQTGAAFHEVNAAVSSGLEAKSLLPRPLVCDGASSDTEVCDQVSNGPTNSATDGKSPRKPASENRSGQVSTKNAPPRRKRRFDYVTIPDTRPDRGDCAKPISGVPTWSDHSSFRQSQRDLREIEKRRQETVHQTRTAQRSFKTDLPASGKVDLTQTHRSAPSAVAGSMVLGASPTGMGGLTKGRLQADQDQTPLKTPSFAARADEAPSAEKGQGSRRDPGAPALLPEHQRGDSHIYINHDGSDTTLYEPADDGTLKQAAPSLRLGTMTTEISCISDNESEGAESDGESATSDISNNMSPVVTRRRSASREGIDRPNGVSAEPRTDIGRPDEVFSDRNTDESEDGWLDRPHHNYQGQGETIYPGTTWDLAPVPRQLYTRGSTMGSSRIVQETRSDPDLRLSHVLGEQDMPIGQPRCASHFYGDGVGDGNRGAYGFRMTPMPRVPSATAKYLSGLKKRYEAKRDEEEGE